MPVDWRWLHSGEEAFAAMEAAIDQAKRSVDFETYIFADSRPGRSLLRALVAAAQRGVQVRVLIDAFGSLYLPNAFWDPLRTAGGTVRWFNPLSLRRFNIRDHRKLLVCDRQVACIGGFNVSDAWSGDGIERGWRDLGMELQGPLADTLALSFERLFDLAGFLHRRPQRLRRARSNQTFVTPAGTLLAAGPGLGRHPIRRQLLADLRRAREVRIIAAYFLPPRRILRAIQRVARRGGRVHLVLPGLSDIALLPSATRGLYGRLLRAGATISEYQPQILHTKFVQIDDVVYVGSANLDRRSLGINYELVVRRQHPTLAKEGRALFADYLPHCQPIEARAWLRSRTAWEKLKSWIACTAFARLDPLLTRYQLKDLR